MRTFGGGLGAGLRQLNTPRHVVLDAVGRVFVADSNNYRVLSLTSKLRLDSVLLSKDRDLVGQPVRLAYIRDTDQLIVSDVTGRVNIFSIH